MSYLEDMAHGMGKLRKKYNVFRGSLGTQGSSLPPDERLHSSPNQSPQIRRHRAPWCLWNPRQFTATFCTSFSHLWMEGSANSLGGIQAEVNYGSGQRGSYVVMEATHRHGTHTMGAALTPKERNSQCYIWTELSWPETHFPNPWKNEMSKHVQRWWWTTAASLLSRVPSTKHSSVNHPAILLAQS